MHSILARPQPEVLGSRPGPATILLGSINKLVSEPTLPPHSP